jgi:hypothetical protein
LCTIYVSFPWLSPMTSAQSLPFAESQVDLRPVRFTRAG